MATLQGSCVVNGTDIYSLGAFILRGGDNELISYPQRKEPAANNWPEHDGLDVDLTQVLFSERSLDVTFGLTASSGGEMTARLNALLELLTNPYGCDMYSREFDFTFALRYLASKYTHRGGLAKSGKKWGELTVTFSMDNPLQFFPPVASPAPSYPGTGISHISVGGYDLARFGIIVRQCYNTLLAQAAAKPPLTRGFEHRSGLMVYPSPATTFSTQQVVIDCTMRATSRQEFYNNYRALFAILSAPGEVILSAPFGEYECFYSSMSGFGKRHPLATSVLVDFTLTLTILNTGSRFGFDIFDDTFDDLFN